MCAPKEPSFRRLARSQDCCMNAAHVSASFRSNAVNSSLSPAQPSETQHLSTQTHRHKHTERRPFTLTHGSTAKQSQIQTQHTNTQTQTHTQTHKHTTNTHRHTNTNGNTRPKRGAPAKLESSTPTPLSRVALQVTRSRLTFNFSCFSELYLERECERICASRAPSALS